MHVSVGGLKWILSEKNTLLKGLICMKWRVITIILFIMVLIMQLFVMAATQHVNLVATWNNSSYSATNICFHYLPGTKQHHHGLSALVPDSFLVPNYCKPCECGPYSTVLDSFLVPNYYKPCVCGPYSTVLDSFLVLQALHVWACRYLKQYARHILPLAARRLSTKVRQHDESKWERSVLHLCNSHLYAAVCDVCRSMAAYCSRRGR